MFDDLEALAEVLVASQLHSCHGSLLVFVCGTWRDNFVL